VGTPIEKPARSLAGSAVAGKEAAADAGCAAGFTSAVAAAFSDVAAGFIVSAAPAVLAGAAEVVGAVPEGAFSQPRATKERMRAKPRDERIVGCSFTGCTETRARAYQDEPTEAKIVAPRQIPALLSGRL
jgi:hypothetical protein